MKHFFHREEQVVSYKKIDFTIEELDQLIQTEKPIAIYHSMYSHKKPFLVITEYNSKGFKMYCDAWPYEEPEQYDAASLYKFLLYQGLGACYIVSELEENNPLNN